MNLSKSISALGTAVWLTLNAHAALTDDPAMAPGTLAYHLATNAAARVVGLEHGWDTCLIFKAPAATNIEQLARITNAAWNPDFWLKGVAGLGATPIGYRHNLGGQGLPTMISPRHYLCATHMCPQLDEKAFMDTNNHVYWRKTLQRLDLTNDTSIGFLDQDLPPSVGFLPVLPANYTNYLPTASQSIVQGIGMNQDFILFSEPMNLSNPGFVVWNSNLNVPNGMTTNWTRIIRNGDSSDPAMLLIGNQLVLVSHNYVVNGGPNYAQLIDGINRTMHQLSKNNHAHSDYQLTEFSLTNWPVVR
jgi:hypothetical protein